MNMAKIVLYVGAKPFKKYSFWHIVWKIMGILKFYQIKKL